jgi:putative FmdB family regulatory protein
MPTYEFRCPQGHEFEKFYRTISGAEAQSACPVCGQVAERIMSPAGFAFKGSGFYLTDYGKNAHREKGSAPKSASGESGSEGSSSAATSDAKSDSAKSESAKSDSAKSAGGEGGGSSTGASASPAPAAESKPAAPKKSGNE